MPRYQTYRPTKADPAATHTRPMIPCTVGRTGSKQSATAAPATIGGAARISAQPITCQPGITRASLPPSVYPAAHTSSAPNR